ncbi:MAG: FAD-binding protein [Acetobacteraceae bacterium]|nr:FAD-binding protein [Acetobacteraceae bacterium]
MLAGAGEEGTGAEITGALALGRIFRAETLAELGSVLGVPGDAIEATAGRFSVFLEERSDLDFARPLTSAMPPLSAGAYYAIPRWPAVHFTAGGIRINPRAEVIDIHGTPIPRLYAAGEVTGGIHGMGRVGGNSTTAPIVFGRIAGTEAAALHSRQQVVGSALARSKWNTKAAEDRTGNRHEWRALHSRTISKAVSRTA